MTIRAQIILALWALSCGLSYWIGWEFRDRSADLAVAETETAAARAETAAVTDARADDLATQAGVADVQRDHAQAAQAQRDHTIQLMNEVSTHVATQPADGPVLSECSLRVWRAASAGAGNAEPVDCGGGPAAVSGGVAGRSGVGN